MPSSTKSKWELTESRKKNMLRSVLECFINADSLIDDAKILLENKRQHRAASLAILGIEELGKAYFLKCIYDEAGEFRWNEDALNKLVDHKFKQEFAFDAFNTGNSVFRSIFMSEDAMLDLNRLLRETQQILRSKGAMDTEKQDMQFVSINQDCSCRIPTSISGERCDYLVTVADMIRSLMRTWIPGNPTVIADAKRYSLQLSKPIKSLQPANEDLKVFARKVSFILRNKNK